MPKAIKFSEKLGKAESFSDGEVRQSLEGVLVKTETPKPKFVLSGEPMEGPEAKTHSIFEEEK